MNNRVDFLGAPGVGKSTLFKELLKQRPKSKPWLTPREAKIIWAQQHASMYANTKRELLKAFLLKSKLFKKLHPALAEELIGPVLTQFLWDQKDKYADFIEVALSGAAIKGKNPLRRILGITWFFEMFSTTVFLTNNHNNRFVFFDESLSQKVFGVLDSSTIGYEDVVMNYFQHIPRPAYLVFCNLGSDILFQRIKTRNKIIPGHRNLTNEGLFEIIRVQQFIAEIGKKALIQRGSVIVELDMQNSLSYNIEVVQNSIKK